MNPSSSDNDDEYNEDEYDQLNDCTFGNDMLKMDPQGFSFVNANEKYRKEIKCESIELSNKIQSTNQPTNTISKRLDDDIVLLKNISLNDSNTLFDNTSINANDDTKIATYKNSIVDQFFLWINPHQIYMLSDLHNMNCRKKKLFNYTHIIPTLEDKMLNRIKLKFHASKYLFGVDMANLAQLFQRKLIECSSLIPFNSDYYYWEYMFRCNPQIVHLNRMLIADDMWLPPVQSTLIEFDSKCSKPIRPLLIKYEDTLGCVSLSSVQFPRKTLGCDIDNDENINKIYDKDQFTDIQKRYYVLSLIDKAFGLAIDYEIKSRVISHQIQTNTKTEYGPDDMIQFQNSLGEFIIKIIPLYPFILNYTQGIDMFIRIFYLLSNIHKACVSKGIYNSLVSNKVDPNQYSNILNHNEFVNIIIFGLGDINELNNHVKCMDYFVDTYTTQFYHTIFFWRFMEMIFTWLIPFCYSNEEPPPHEYILKFLLLLPTAIKTTHKLKLFNNSMSIVISTQQKIIKAIKTTNFNTRDSVVNNKKINDAKDTILRLVIAHNTNKL